MKYYKRLVTVTHCAALPAIVRPSVEQLQADERHAKVLRGRGEDGEPARGRGDSDGAA
jgi:hypothetical protein